LPIDRVFTLQGFGTIITGTLIEGMLGIGDEIEVLPGGYRSKIRGLQIHNKTIQLAHPGNRIAVNLTNIEKGLLKRGDVLVKPGSFTVTSLIDVNVNLLDINNNRLQHNDVVNFYAGTSHRVARVRLLSSKKLESGECGFLQLEFEKPVCVKNGDHYIIRKASPSITLGGGEIINAIPRTKYKLQDTEALENIKARLSGSILDILEKEAQRPISIHELKKVVNRDDEEIRIGLGKLIEKGVVIEIDSGSNNSKEYISSNALEELKKSIEDVVTKLHLESPARKGFSCIEIAKKLKKAESDLSPMLQVMVNTNKILSDGHLYWKHGTTILLSPAQQKSFNWIIELIDKNPFSPPTFHEMDEILGSGLIRDLIKNGQLIQVSPDIVFREKEYLMLVSLIDELLSKNEKITVTALRDKFHTSRKFIIPFLEHMDRIRKTRRSGDERIRY
jgi:selenocysteine-specific elongation factor